MSTLVVEALVIVHRAREFKVGGTTPDGAAIMSGWSQGGTRIPWKLKFNSEYFDQSVDVVKLNALMRNIHK